MVLHERPRTKVDEFLIEVYPSEKHEIFGVTELFFCSETHSISGEISMVIG